MGNPAGVKRDFDSLERRRMQALALLKRGFAASQEQFETRDETRRDLESEADVETRRETREENVNADNSHSYEDAFHRIISGTDIEPQTE